MSLPLPDTTAAICLASIAVHAEELLGPDGHAFDREAIHGLLANPHVRAYLAELRPLGLLPVLRSGETE